MRARPARPALRPSPLSGCVTGYTAPVSIGNQSFDLVVDTGSGDARRGLRRVRVVCRCRGISSVQAGEPGDRRAGAGIRHVRRRRRVVGRGLFGLGTGVGTNEPGATVKLAAVAQQTNFPSPVTCAANTRTPQGIIGFAPSARRGCAHQRVLRPTGRDRRAGYLRHRAVPLGRHALARRIRFDAARGGARLRSVVLLKSGKCRLRVEFERRFRRRKLNPRRDTAIRGCTHRFGHFTLSSPADGVRRAHDGDRQECRISGGVRRRGLSGLRIRITARRSIRPSPRSMRCFRLSRSRLGPLPRSP